MGKTVKSILLLVLLVAFAAVGGIFWLKYDTLTTEYEGKVAAAEQTLAAEQQKLAELDPASPSGQAAIAAAREDATAMLHGDVEALEARLAELDAQIADAEAALEQAKTQEDYDYYKAVYDSLLKGKTEVEGYIAETEQ